MRYSRKKQSGFSFIELLLSLGVITVLGFTALQSKIERTEKEVAEAFGTSVALYSQAVASYIADEGTAVPSGTFTGFDWLKSSGCGGSAPQDYVPCSWNPRLPFNIALETEVIYGTGVVTDPCPEPVGHVCAETRLTVPATNGQERLDLAAEMLHATQGSSNSIRATQQRFSLNDLGQLQVTAVGTQAPATLFLRVDGVNNMDATLDMGNKNLVDVGDLTAEGEVEMARVVDRDDPAFVMDPNAQSILQNLDARGDFAAAAGGNLNALSVFGAGADIESNARYQDEAFFHDLAKFVGGETDFNATVESSGGTAAEFTVADSQDLADFHSELEIVGIGVVGGACNATIENIRFNSAGEMLECVGGLWQYAGIETHKGTITYYSLDSTNSYGEFFWAGDGIDLPGKHHVCSAQSIESSNLAEGGGARIESTSGPDQFGQRSFQYLAAAGVRDANEIPLQLQSGERTVICLALGPEPVQATVGTQTNSAPTGSVSCTSGMTGEPFLSTLNVSDPDTPLLYRWSTSGPCSIVRANTTGNFQAEAWIQRGPGSGTCTVRAQVTDYYNATRTISSSCTVRTRACPTEQGLCSCTGCTSGTDIDTTPPEPPGYDDRPPPDGQGPWDPTETWVCRASCGGVSDSCTEGSACRGPEPGSCSSTINRCSGGNSTNYSASRTLDQTIHRWTCRGLNGGSNVSCEVIHDHTRPCDPTTDRVNGQCGTNFGDCTAGNYEFASNQSWVCRGICGGTDDECDSPNSNREDGSCGNTFNDCPTGTLQPVNSSEWNCLGINGGSNALGCTVPVNGVCGSSQGTCYQGTSSGNTNPWTCQGSNGGSDATCEIAECGTTENTCDRGTYVNITGTHEWRCRGNVDGQNFDDVTCEVGLCGPARGACDQGTSSGNTNPWDCEGSVSTSFGDDDLSCIVGVCGTADDSTNGCMQGTWEHVDDTATDVLWRCLGDYHDDTVTTDDADCTLGLPMCDDVKGQCDVGTPSGNTNPWTCSGAGDTKECRIGVCDFDHDGDCDIGDASASANPWVCEGDDPGSMLDDDDCAIGVCGTADTFADGCLVGTWVSVTDLIGPPQVIRWRCEGSHPGPGETDDDTDCEQRNGTCDSVDPLLPGDCDAGVSNDPSGATNPWICEGTGGGTDETCTIGVCGDEDDMTNGCRAGVWQAAPDHEWTCTGNVKNDGCYHGVCDYAGPGQCVAPSTPSSLDYEWSCRGADSMSTADDVDCVKAQCNPTGSDNDIEACITGIRSDLTDLADGTARWMCEGNDQNRTDDDAGPCMPGPTDGVCKFVKDSGGEPIIGQCLEGQSSGLNNPWTCEGVNGGADVACKYGVCGYEDDPATGCLVGTHEHVTGDRWHCRGNHPSTAFTDDDAINCEPPEVKFGKCDYSQIGACEQGDSSDLSGNTNPWWCRGDHPDSNETSDDDECYIGICGMALDTCAVGTFEAVIGPTWNCRGSDNLLTIEDATGCTGTDGCGITCPTSDYSATPIGLLYWDTDANSGSCRVSLGNAYPYGTTLGIWPPSQLSCDAAQCGATQNTCDSGQYLAYNESLGQWACLTAGPNNAGNVIVCMPSVDGACGTADNAVQGCTAGTWQDETGDGWTCLGTGGGADTSCGMQVMPPYSCIPLSAEMGTLSSGRPGAGDPWPPLCSAASYGDLTGYSVTDANEATAECAFNAAQGYTRDQSAGLSGGDIGIVDCVMGGFISPVQPVPRTLNGIPLLINAGYNSLAPTDWNDWYFSDISICESRPPSYFSSWTECASYYTP